MRVAYLRQADRLGALPSPEFTANCAGGEGAGKTHGPSAVTLHVHLSNGPVSRTNRSGGSVGLPGGQQPFGQYHHVCSTKLARLFGCSRVILTNSRNGKNLSADASNKKQ